MFSQFILTNKNSNILFNLDSAFLTARERSLNNSINCYQIRTTYRLSKAERQRRIDFVRDKHIERFIEILNIQTRNSQSFEHKPSYGIVYNRGKLRVNALAFAAEFYKQFDLFVPFCKLFVEFWEINSHLRLFSRTLKTFRRFFGSSCLQTGELKLTEKGSWEVCARIVFKDTFFNLQPWKQDLIQSMDLERFNKIFYNSVMYLALAQKVQSIREFNNSVAFRPGVIHYLEGDVLIRDKFLKSIPHFNGNILGDRPLTEKQIAGMRNRKAKFVFVLLWYLLWKGPVIRRDLFLQGSVRLSLYITQNKLVLYSPYVHLVDRSAQGKPPLVRLVSPSAIQGDSHLEYLKPIGFDPDDMAIRTYQNKEMIENNRAFRNLQQSRLIRKFSLSSMEVPSPIDLKVPEIVINEAPLVSDEPLSVADLFALAEQAAKMEGAGSDVAHKLNSFLSGFDPKDFGGFDDD